MSDGRGMGDNSRVQLPSGRADATKWVVNRLKRLDGEKQMITERVRDIKVEAREKYAIPAKRLQQSVMFAGMTPEKRERWTSNINAAAALYGYSPLGVADAAGRAVDPVLYGYTEQLVSLKDERKAISDETRELYRAAREGGIDVDSVREVLRFGRIDPAEIEERVAALDVMATFLIENKII